jgi:hypothetical protein
MSGIDLENFWDEYLSQTLPNYTLIQKKGATSLDSEDEDSRKPMYKSMANIYANYATSTLDTERERVLKAKYSELAAFYNEKAGTVAPLTSLTPVNVYKSSDELEVVQFDKNLMEQDVIMQSIISKPNLEFEVKTNDNIVAFGEGNPFSKVGKDEQDKIYERVNKMFNKLIFNLDRSFYLFEYQNGDFTPIIFTTKDDYSTQEDLNKLFVELTKIDDVVVTDGNLDITKIGFGHKSQPAVMSLISKLIAKMIQCILYKTKEKMPDMFVDNELYLMRLETLKRLATAGAGRSMATIFPHNDSCLETYQGINKFNCDLVSIIYFDVKNNNTLKPDKYTSAGFLFSEDIPMPLTSNMEKNSMATSSTITDFIKYINIKPRLITNVPVKTGSYAIWRNSGKYFEKMSDLRKIEDSSGNQLFAQKEEDLSFKYINPKIDFTNSANIKNNIFTWHISPLNILPKTKSGDYHIDNYDIDYIFADITKGLDDARAKMNDDDTFGAIIETTAKEYFYREEEEKEESYKPLTQANAVTLKDDTQYWFKCSINSDFIEIPIQVLEKKYSGSQIKQLGNKYVSAFVDRNFMTVRRSPFNPFRTLRDLFHEKINVAIECKFILSRINSGASFDTEFVNNITKILEIHELIYGKQPKIIELGTKIKIVTPQEIINNKARLILFAEADQLYKNFLENRESGRLFSQFCEAIKKLNKKINIISTNPITLQTKAVESGATAEILALKPNDINDDGTDRYQYYKKYLKYKQKYMQLQKKLIIRK